MLQFLLFIIAVGVQSNGQPGVVQTAATPAPEPQTDMPAAQTPAAEAPAAEAAIPGLQAEPQDPTGRFTTATEVKPILTATKASWISTREWEGQDLVYVTQLWSWRCGLAQIQVSVNGGPQQVWPMPPCHLDQQSPNAILESDGLPYAAFPLGSVERLDVQVVYDDLTTDSASYDGNGVMLP